METPPGFGPADALMLRGVEEAVFPGAVLLVQRKREIVYHRAFGVTDVRSKKPVALDTLFDLASLTKPLATTLAVLSLVQAGDLLLDQPVGSLLPDLKGTAKENIEVRHLLCHTSGLPAHRPYYRHLSALPISDRRQALTALAAAEPLVNGIGEKPVYSDIGFMLLRWLVETTAGMRLDRFVSEKIYAPMGIDRLFYIDLSNGAPEGDFAATQWCPWRCRVIEKEVGDENASAVGGVDGQAGLFGTARAVGELLGELTSAYYGESDRGVFRSRWVREFFQKESVSGRALGFDMPVAEDSSSGHFFSERTVGHLGFTGVSFWSDLEKEISVILLTNRVHPSVDNIKIRLFRPIIHDAVMVCLSSDSG